MVYINPFRAFFITFVIILLSSFILFVAALWVDKAETSTGSAVSNLVSNQSCNCLTVLSDSGTQLVIRNINCDYADNVTVNGYFLVGRLLKENVVTYDYQGAGIFILAYNDCLQNYTNS